MPASTDAATATRDDEALRFAGVLSRAQVPALWKAMPALDGVRTLDLTAVASVDSAGLALLAEVAARCADMGHPVVLIPERVEGSKDDTPAGLSELRSAYRLDAALAYVVA